MITKQEEKFFINSQFLYEQESEFRHELIYFIIVDRFFDGSPDNDQVGKKDLFDSTKTKWGEYWGGDLKGVIDKIDYIKRIGVTAVWISPLFEQVDDKMSDSAPMHGYWTKDFKRINPHFIPLGDSNRISECKILKELVNIFNKNNIKLILDIVCNHSSPEINGSKGVVCDDGVPLADFNNDINDFYYHYPSIDDWDDEFQLIHGEMAGLATFNEKNVNYRKYICSAMKDWLDVGFDAFRVDTLKHMPIWFWQEFVSEIRKHRPSTFLFGEYGFGKPWDDRSVKYANNSGMSILDFGLCDAIRFAFSGEEPGGFNNIKKVLDLDHVYTRANQLITFIDNHDMPRFLSVTDSVQNLELATVLLLTLRGIPCIFYGTEQYLVNNTNGGGDPYNRPMMDSWDLNNSLIKIIQKLSKLRSTNPALTFGSFQENFINESIFSYTRKHRGFKVFTLINQGNDTILNLKYLDIPDGNYNCILTERVLNIKNGELINYALSYKEANIIAINAEQVSGDAILDIQVNGYETKPGETIVITGDHDEFGGWDLTKALKLEYINKNTWFGDFGFHKAAGEPIMIKVAVLKTAETDMRNISQDDYPVLENMLHRHIIIPKKGRMKLDLVWERS
tara:strand:- start:28848 stop:30707 length:1860 start_codon:yes stop_codon:yes gene_type:complete